jgi:uncharacterized membrane protein
MMLDTFEFGFQKPAQLWLLLFLLPALWWIGFKSLAGLGPWRKWFSLALRSIVLILLVFVLAQFQWKRTHDKFTVVFLLDQSASIPQEKRDFMLRYAHEAVDRYRKNKDQLAGAIVFGGSARPEVAPYNGTLPLMDISESAFDLNRGATNIEAGLKLAKAMFPEDTAKRIVVISDGNENIGDALTIANSLANDGIGIDVIPVDLLIDSEIIVEKVIAPSDIRRGQSFEIRTVINYQTDPSIEDPQPVSGTLRLKQKTLLNEQIIAEQAVTLQPGKNVLSVSHDFDKAAVFTIDAEFEPDDQSVDRVRQNNLASAFTHVRGKGRVLFIEHWENTGEFNYLINRLQASEIEVDVLPNNRLFTSPAELLAYDCVVLANVARASGSENGEVEQDAPTVGFSDEQIQMLVRNTEEMGCGLVMLGGNRSFGAGGWANTALEKAMPVDFQIKNDRVDAVGALALIMHACEMADGNYWQMKVCSESIKVLGPMDYCGVVEWNMGQTKWLWKKPNGMDRVLDNREFMLKMVQRMTPGDMPDFVSSMQLALSGLTNTNASIKHCVIISDGDPLPPSQALLKRFKDSGIMISTVAIGTHGPAGSTPLKEIAAATGGKYYVVTNAKALPRIFQREARRVSKPVIKENPAGYVPIGIKGYQLSPIMQGLDVNEFERFDGFVMTTIKSNPLVEQLIISNEPDDNGENSTLLATWQYGVGRATVFTSDAGHKWTNEWTRDPKYDKFFTQLIRNAMRPINESANFEVATELRDGKARILITAIGEDDQFLNFLKMSARGLSPDLNGVDIDMKQIAPGKYEGVIDASDAGNYLFTILPGEGYQRLSTGINVPYSNEYSDRFANINLLQSIATLTPDGGQPGQLVDGTLSRNGLEKLLQTDPFRSDLRKPRTIHEFWPSLVVIVAVLFFADVFLRRVAIRFDWILPFLATTWHRIRGQRDATKTEQSMARLQARKQEIESRQATNRFVSTEADSPSESIDVHKIASAESVPSEKSSKTRPSLDLSETDDPPEDFTSRLLKAKRRMQRQDKPKED